MRYSTYLKEHLHWLWLFIWMLFSIETFLLTVFEAYWLMIYVAVVFTASYVAGTYIDYHRNKNYLEDIIGTLDELEKKYLFPEMIQPGKTQEEKQLFNIYENMERSMNEQVSEQLRVTKEYKEYIEMWIHEVKVPIAAARMIMENHREIDKGIGEQIDRLENYVEQALFYARSSAVEKDYLIKPISLKTIVEHALLQRKTELMAMKASVDIADCDVEVYSDGKWMEFIVGQILDNSIKYAKPTGLVLKIYSEEVKEQTQLCIEDNGIGVKTEEIERVFDKGFTGSNGRKYRKSTGIGLYLCKKLCTRLGHNMIFKSKEGEGSKVIFIIPKSNYMDEVR